MRRRLGVADARRELRCASLRACRRLAFSCRSSFSGTLHAVSLTRQKQRDASYLIGVFCGDAAMLYLLARGMVGVDDIASSACGRKCLSTLRARHARAATWGQWVAPAHTCHSPLRTATVTKNATSGSTASRLAYSQVGTACEARAPLRQQPHRCTFF